MVGFVKPVPFLQDNGFSMRNNEIVFRIFQQTQIHVAKIQLQVITIRFLSNVEDGAFNFSLSAAPYLIVD